MKRFILVMSVFTMISLCMEQPTPGGEKKVEISKIDPSVIFAKDNENLLMFATGEMIGEDALLQDLEETLNKLVASLDATLQKQLDWSQQFTLFKDRILF